jgi:hypothetical protein
MSYCLPLLLVLAPACSALTGTAPKGSEDAPEQAELARMKEVGGRANGVIVWSSSRLGNHDLFTMKTDGSDVKAITKGEQVDWFYLADFSFTRSRRSELHALREVSLRETHEALRHELGLLRAHPDIAGSGRCVAVPPVSRPSLVSSLGLLPSPSAARERRS